MTGLQLINFQKKGYLGSTVKKVRLKAKLCYFQSVQAHRCKNLKNAIIGHLNVNSLRNKFVAINELIKIKLISV